MGKTVIIDESIMGDLKDLMSMTQFKFKSNIKKFLASLLEDPVGTDVDAIFKYNGLDKNKLIKSLVDNKVIKKKLTIDDHDADGNPHTAKMIVRYSVPKERFNDRLDALYGVLFPDVPAIINEEGGGAASCSGVDGNGFGSGEYVQPLFGMISRSDIQRSHKKKGKKIGGDAFTETLSEAITGEDVNKSAALYVYNEDSDHNWYILCARRSNKKDDEEGGKWNPPMGHLHKGETLKEGALRECLEESGIDFSKYKDKLVKKDSHNWGSNFVLQLGDYVNPSVTIDDFEPKKGDEENSKFIWLPLQDIDKKTWAWTCGENAKKFIPGEVDMDDLLTESGIHIKNVKKRHHSNESIDRIISETIEEKHIPGKKKNNIQHFVDFMYSIGQKNTLPKARKPIEKYIKDNIDEACRWFIDSGYNIKTMGLDFSDTNVMAEWMMWKIRQEWTFNNRGLIYVERCVDIPDSGDKNDTYYDVLTKSFYSVGECWSSKKGNGVPYCATGGGAQYAARLCGWVHPDSIDWVETIYISFYKQNNEAEIRMNSNANVEIDKITYTKVNRKAGQDTHIANDTNTIPFDGPLVVNASSDKYSHNHMTAMQHKLDNGIDLDNRYNFDDNGLAIIRVNGATNIMNRQGQLLWPYDNYMDWLNFAEHFNDWGFLVTKEIKTKIDIYESISNLKYNIIGFDGKLFFQSNNISDWPDNIRLITDDLAMVTKGQKVNVFNKYDVLTLDKPVDEWFDRIEMFKNGLAVARIGEQEGKCKYNYIQEDGSLLWDKPVDEWFDYAAPYDVKVSFVSVNFNNKQYLLSLKDKSLYELTEENIINLLPIKESIVSRIVSNVIYEATASGVSGSGLPGEYTAPAFIDKETADRTPGDTCGMHDRVGNSNLEEGRKKVCKNDKGEIVPETCTCGGKIGLYICGEPVYKCAKCGKYYGTMPFPSKKKSKK